MDKIKVQVQILNTSAHLPDYQSELAAGMDLVFAGEEAVVVKPGERKLLPTGIAIALPQGFEAH